MKYAAKYKDRITGEPLQVIDSVLIARSPLPCIMCKEPTVFVDVCSEGHMCSEECDSAFYSELMKDSVSDVSDQ